MRKPRSTQILPRRIRRLNQRDLLRPPRALQFLLALNRLTDIGESLEPDKPIAVVSRRESGVGLGLVLEGARTQVTRDADIQGSALARQDVGEVEVLTHGKTLAETHRMRRVVNHASAQTADPSLRLPHRALRAGAPSVLRSG